MSEYADKIQGMIDEIERLRDALVEIDAVAVSKKAGAAIKMQAIARRALRAQRVTNGER